MSRENLEIVRRLFDAVARRDTVTVLTLYDPSVVTSRGRGRASGLEVEWADNVGIWTLREGRIVRVVWF